jgi:hypothetical protein
MAEYVQIAPGVEGFAYVDSETGELVTLDADTPGSAQTGLRPATPDEVAGAKRGHAAQGFGQKALGLGEQAASGATFGLVRGTSPEAQARSQVLEAENPNLKTAARLTGTILPALATGGLVGAGLGAVGVTGRVAGALTFGAEELTQAAAYEMADAAETDRNVEIGNIAQGLLEGAAFLGAARFAGKLGRRTASAVDDIAGDPAQALARAHKASATAADVERATPTWAEAKHYAENVEQIHTEVNELGSQAGDKLFGRNGSASRAHNVSEKKADIFGKMKDADGVKVAESLDAYADQAELLAEKMASPQARSTIKQHAERLRAAAGLDVEDAAIAMDEYKKHLDLWREHLGQVKATAKMTAKANVAAIDEVLEPVRKGLEDEAVWGKIWAAKQAKENALWSGPEGIINSRARWQAKLMEREAGAAGRARQGLSSVPVFRMHGDMSERILGMSKHDRDYIIRNLKQDIKQTREMGEIKRMIGGTETRASVDESLADLAEFEDAVNEIDRIARTVNVHGPRLKKLGVGQRSAGEELLDVAAPAVGAAFGGPMGALAGGLASRGLKKMALDAMTPVAKESKAATLSELRAAIAARNGMRASGKFRGDPSKLDPAELKARLKGLGRKVTTAGKETLIEAAGGTALAAGALGVANMAAETAAIKELDQHSKDATERAMLTLASPEASILPLPDIATRFQGEHATLTDAYRAKMADLRRLVDDPDEFIARTTAAFQPLADAGHPEVAAKLITRLMVGARYLMENAPPSIAVSMFTPDGGTPDEIAILQFAPIWEAVWRPTDTVRDFAQRLATPSAVRAIREVHPDVYARMLGQVFQTLAPGGPGVDFETKRYLDNTMQMGAALGRSFSPKMSDLLARGRQDNKQSTPSLGGENNIAPALSTAGFSKGPTAIR